MTNKLKKARIDLLKSARELDKVSKCPEAKKKLMNITIKALLKEYYKY
jgi:hypothetical protein